MPRWLLLAGLLLFLVFAAYLGWSLYANASGPPARNSEALDELSAPDFTVATAAGRAFRLSQQKGKGVVLVFTSSGCVSCGPKLTALAQLYREYRGEGLEALVLDLDNSDTKEAFVVYLSRWQGSDLPWAMDAEYRVTVAYGVNSLGTVVGINRDGRIVYRNAVFMPDAHEAMKKTVEIVLQ